MNGRISIHMLYTVQPASAHARKAQTEQAPYSVTALGLPNASGTMGKGALQLLPEIIQSPLISILNG